MGKEKEPILSWDEHKIIDDELNYRLEEQKDLPPEDRMSEDKIKRELWEGDTLNVAWESLEECLTELITKLSPDGYWCAEVKNFGWRGLDGKRKFKVEKGAEFINAILPKCDCTFYIYKTEEGLSINNYHHDSPAGNEWYYLKPMTYEEYYDEEEE